MAASEKKSSAPKSKRRGGAPGRLSAAAPADAASGGADAPPASLAARLAGGPVPASARSTSKVARTLFRLWREDSDPDAFLSVAEATIAAGDDAALVEARELCRAAMGDSEAERLWSHLRIRAEMDSYLSVPEPTEGDLLTETMLDSDESDPVNVDLMVVGIVGVPGLTADSRAFAWSLSASGLFSDDTELRMLSGWCRPEDIEALTPCQSRRIIAALMANELPSERDLHCVSEPYSVGISVLVGVAISARDESSSASILYDVDNLMGHAMAKWAATVTAPPRPMAFGVTRPCAPSLLKFEICEFLNGLSNGAATAHPRLALATSVVH